MSACPELNYTNVSASAWQCCKNAVSAYVVIGQDSGEASSHGLTVRWTYVPAAKTLSIQCTAHIFLIGCTQINDSIDAAVKGCLPA
ncbi:MAG TPA: hypothetical protein VII56_19320 [Rhizomicrobium sp.]